MPLTHTKAPPEDVVPVAYAPPGGRAFEVEAKPAWIADGRASLPFTGRYERPDFHVLLLVAAGRLRHTIDFEQVEVPRGGLLLVRPGQLHRFELDGRWSGWLLLFRPEAVAPARDRPDDAGDALDLPSLVQQLPATMVLEPAEEQAFIEGLERLSADAQHLQPSPALPGLLRAQLHALLWRLGAARRFTAFSDLQASPAALRLQRLRGAIDAHFLRLRDVQAYADLLRCSTRTLNRLAAQLGRSSVKRMIDERVALEAKRMLVHTTAPVAQVSDALGFDEPTNFTKFFKRCAGCTPAAFRERAAGGIPAAQGD